MCADAVDVRSVPLFVCAAPVVTRCGAARYDGVPRVAAARAGSRLPGQPHESTLSVARAAGCVARMTGDRRERRPPRRRDAGGRQYPLHNPGPEEGLAARTVPGDDAAVPPTRLHRLIDDLGAVTANAAVIPQGQEYDEVGTLRADEETAEEPPPDAELAASVLADGFDAWRSSVVDNDGDASNPTLLEAHSSADDLGLGDEAILVRGQHSFRTGLDTESVKKLVFFDSDVAALPESSHGSTQGAPEAPKKRGASGCSRGMAKHLRDAREQLLARRRQHASPMDGSSPDGDSDTSGHSVISELVSREQRYRRLAAKKRSDWSGVGSAGSEAPLSGRSRVYLESGLPFRPVDRKQEKDDAVFSAALEVVSDMPIPTAGKGTCERCGFPASEQELAENEGHICNSCFSYVHYQRRPAVGPDDGTWASTYSEGASPGEIAWRERLAAESALQNAKNLVAQRSRRAVQPRADLRPQIQNVAAPAGAGPTLSHRAKSAPGHTEPASPHGMGLSDESGAGGDTDGFGAGRGGGGGNYGGSREWRVKASERSLRTINPIRQLVQGIAGEPNPDKKLIDLSVGDPTRYGNLRIGDDVIEKFCEVVRSGAHNGYTQSMGSIDARRAVAERYSLPPNAPLTPDDVVLASGVSGALELALGALVNEGDNVLLPRPGFPLFKTMLDGFGASAKYYSVLPDRSWEIDLKDLEAQIDERTVAIVVNNPSNPCGSVYSAEHVRDIVRVAARLRLPIIADEVYADMAFSGHDFVPIASMSTDVPILSVGGISKQFVAPGWRAGWLLIHDRNGVFEKGGVRLGIRQLTTRMLMTNAPVQGVIPYMLEGGAASEAFRTLMSDLESNAQVMMDGLAECTGFQCVKPQGSMYLMAKVDVSALGFDDDLTFTKALRAEESVFVLPGQCFQAPNFVRIVFCAPHAILKEAAQRIKVFCERHSARALRGSPADADGCIAL